MIGMASPASCGMSGAVEDGEKKSALKSASVTRLFITNLRM